MLYTRNEHNTVYQLYFRKIRLLGNCIQCPVRSHSRKNTEERSVCMYITESLCCAAEAGTTLESTIGQLQK